MFLSTLTSIYLSITLIIIATYLLKNKLQNPLISGGFAITVWLFLFIASFYYIADYLTGNGIDESIYYHLTTDWSGVGWRGFRRIIALTLIWLLIILLISFFVYKFTSSKNSNTSTHNKYTVLALILLISSLYTNPGTAGVLHLLSLFTTQSVNTNLTPPVKYEKPKKIDLNNKNIVYIYLESFERTYLNESIFPGLTPNLKELESHALSFTDIRQVYGTSWTIAGMVSSQCGIPLINPIGASANAMNGANSFLPGAVCIGDILKENGYNLNYLGGSSLDFAGKGGFYKTHGFNHVKGSESLKPKLDDPEYLNFWGLYDDSLFEIVKTRFDVLVKESQPFGLFTLNLDTHHPEGHESKYCSNYKYNDGSNSILNAIHCTDKMVSELVDYIRSDDAYENTIIVLASDHLAMTNSAYELLNQGNRKNLFMIISEDIHPQSISNTGSTLDITPIILSQLGGEVDSFGLGRNLLKNHTSITESENDMDSFLKDNRGFFSSLWSNKIKSSLTDQENRY